MKTYELQFYRNQDLGKAHWIPAVDIYQTQSGWLVKLELAGVRREDLHVRLEGSKLSISGIRLDQTVTFGHLPYSLEISYNSFERVIDLPESFNSVQTCSLGIEFMDGMLFVKISRQEIPP